MVSIVCYFRLKRTITMIIIQLHLNKARVFFFLGCCCSKIFDSTESEGKHVKLILIILRQKAFFSIERDCVKCVNIIN